MLISVETGVQSFHVEQKYNAAKPSSATPLFGLRWTCNSGYRNGQVPLLRKEGAMTSSWAAWGAPDSIGEEKYIGYGWPIQAGFIPATSFVMELPNALHPWAPIRYRISRPDGEWFMIAACWFGAPALADRQCKVMVRSGSNLPHGLPYEPIMLTATEWAHGGSGGSMSLATMRIEQL
jgi:hypothetical protein